ncbi:MAG: regulatory protein RecX [Chromatiales bacterium]|nr:regulatory protein RecX [Chromatiales bacterium]
MSAEDAGPTEVRAGAVRLLARREHSRRELARKLAERGHDSAVVEAVLDDLAAEGLLDEARFAEVYARMRVERGYGPLAIRAQLRERGIGDELIEAALAGWSDADWFEQLRAVARRRFGAALPTDNRERARRMRALAARGFPESLVRRLFR